MQGMAADGKPDAVADLFLAIKAGVSQSVLDACKAAAVGSEGEVIFRLHPTTPTFTTTTTSTITTTKY